MTGPTVNLIIKPTLPIDHPLLKINTVRKTTKNSTIFWSWTLHFTCPHGQRDEIKLIRNFFGYLPSRHHLRPTDEIYTNTVLWIKNCFIYAATYTILSVTVLGKLKTERIYTWTKCSYFGQWAIQFNTQFPLQFLSTIALYQILMKLLHDCKLLAC